MANRNRDVGREQAWRRRLAKQAASGLGVRAFCRREQLAESAFYAWRRTIAERDVEARPELRRPAFVPAVVRGEPRREGSITIELAGRRVLRLPEAISAERVAELVEALESRIER
jgi:hypothetical protein